MAGIKFIAGANEVPMTATILKTVLQIKAATNQRCNVTKLEITGNAAIGSTSTTPMLVKLTRTTSGFGSFTSSATIQAKLDPSYPETLQTTVAGNATAEPTVSSDTGYHAYISPQGGFIDTMQYGWDLQIPGNTALNVTITDPTGDSVSVIAWCEE